LYTERTILLKYLKIELDTDLIEIMDHQNNYVGNSEIIMSDHQNNYVGNLSVMNNAAKNFSN